MNREKIYNLTELLVIGSVTSVGFLIGGTVGASVMAGLGINLASNILDKGSSNLKSKWIESKDGILNHDIQRALLRAFDKSINEIEKEYLELEYVKELSKESKKIIKQFFKTINDSTKTNFTSILTNLLNEDQIQIYLSKKPDNAENELWSKMNLDAVFTENNKQVREYYDDFEYSINHLKTYLKENLHCEIKYWFGEELKTDAKENNKAWRAFQRLLLEGIKDDVNSVKENQKENHTKLLIVEESILKLKDSIDNRLPNEPFSVDFEKGIKADIKEIFDKTKEIDKTTKKTDKKVDILINELVEPKSKPLTEIPKEIQKLFDEAQKIWELGNGQKTKELFEKALDLSLQEKNNLAIAKSKKGIASVLYDLERNALEARPLFVETLKVFKTENDKKNVIHVLTILGAIETETGNINRASAYLNEALGIAKKENLKEKISSVYHRLGWLEHHKGNSEKAFEFYDKSMDIYYSLYDETKNDKEQNDILWGIASGYHHKGLTYRVKGDIHNTILNFEKAIEWYKKADVKFETAKLLYILSELSFTIGEYDIGNNHLMGAKNIFFEIENDYWTIKCTELDAKMNFTLGKREKALELLQEALNEAKQRNEIELQIIYTNHLGYFYFENKDFDKAEQFYTQAKNLSLQNELFKEYKISLKKLAEIAHHNKKYEIRDKYIEEGIESLKKQTEIEQTNPKLGYIYGDIGSFYDLIQKDVEALEYFEKSKRIFEGIEDIAGQVNCLGSIARIKRRHREYNIEFEIYKTMKKMLDGTPYYDLIAGTSINLGEIHFELGNLNEAKILFDEALIMCKKYNLRYIGHLEKSLKRLSDKEKTLKPSELDFNELIDELFYLTDWFPEAKDSILRLWLWARQNDLYSNYKNAVGVKFMVCQDNLNVFKQFTDDISLYGDLFLQVVSEKYPGNGIDMIPYPKDKPLFFDIDLITVTRI